MCFLFFRINLVKYIINYRNLGYSEGYKAGLNKTGNITYTYHEHTSACKCTGTYEWGYSNTTNQGITFYRATCNKCGDTKTSDSIGNINKYIGTACTNNVCGYKAGQIMSATITY